MGMVDNQATDEIWIVTELLNAGPLWDYCTGQHREKLYKIQKLEIGSHCWSGLAYLHENGIVHKDISPKNIVVCIYCINFLIS